MSLQLLGMGVIGIRLFDRILTAEARQPDELADQIVAEIHDYLPVASPLEKEILFLLVRDTHDILSRYFCSVESLAVRRQVASVIGEMAVRARRLAGHRTH
ncbi:hypothetical protein [Chitinilyticum piscinae]|uniref:Uncharacterized protein n=1 Tax=Chitinilyticum piscinae TaxID=2866724 RepID=A0A8J7G1Z4_9NEIS|nr:hypothetical protein [Chitinilyticum piscinae]MBE9610505.1 hypothetical protein [Chitinilyticum piscinae]